MTRADLDGEVVEVWPENWTSFQLLVDVRTQWRGAGMTVIGLDYNVVYHKLDRMNLSPADYDEAENDVRVMERAALLAMKET